MINQSANNRHWNHFLALDEGAAVLSRYIEFTTDNFDVYSIELARLLLAAASEVDVVAKIACANISQTKHENIEHYRTTLLSFYDGQPEYKVSIPRYGLELTPWESWASGTNPDWWHAYNNVKHERNTYFGQANLQNTLNALAGLHVMLIYAFPHEAREGSLWPPSLFAIPEDAHDGWINFGSRTGIQYRVD